MTLPEPPPRSQAPSAGGKPSLMGADAAASASGFGEATTQPLRMLDSLQPRTASRPPLARQRTAWLLAIGLAVMALAIYGWWDQNGRGVVSPGLIDASRQSRAAESPVAAPELAAPTIAAATTATTAAAAASASASDADQGPASIERTASADARIATARPFDARPVPRAVDPFAATPMATASKPMAASPPPFALSRVAAVPPPRPTARPVPTVVAQARAPSPSVDPDVNLFSAMLARLSGDGNTAAPRPTIAQLVERCEAQSAKDSIEAFECKRRICAGYWGKADACPMALAPKRD